MTEGLHGRSGRSPDIARQPGLPRNTQGVVAAEVRRNALAQEAGLRPGDVIEEVNRQPVQSSRDVKRAFGAAANKDLVLLINRGGVTAFFVIERGGS